MLYIMGEIRAREKHCCRARRGTTLYLYNIIIMIQRRVNKFMIVNYTTLSNIPFDLSCGKIISMSSCIYIRAIYNNIYL